MDREASPGQELSSVPSASLYQFPSICTDQTRLHGSYASLPDSDDLHDSSTDDARHEKTSSSQKYAKLIDTLRHLRVQFVVSLFAHIRGARWNADTEYRKVAVYKNRTVAAAHSLLHIIPLAGASTLLVFQWTSLWVSRTDDYSTALQFAAKIHELAMQASLVETLLFVI